jgi:hypothetical protein
MDLMLFADSPFGDKDSMKDFLFENSQAHSLIATTLEKNGYPVSSQPIGDMENELDWLRVHSSIHQDELDALGLGDMGFDLSEVDLQDESQYRDWMQLHAIIHQYVSSALGLV